MALDPAPATSFLYVLTEDDDENKQVHCCGTHEQIHEQVPQFILDLRTLHIVCVQEQELDSKEHDQLIENLDEVVHPVDHGPHLQVVDEQ